MAATATKCEHGTKHIVDVHFKPLFNFDPHATDYKNDEEVSRSTFMVLTMIISIAMVLLGIAYAVCRFLNYINLRANTCETELQMIVRFCLSALLLATLGLLTYTLVDAIYADRNCYKLNEVLQNDYINAQSHRQKYKEIIARQLDDVHILCHVNTNYTEIFLSKKSEILKYIKDMHEGIDELSDNILEWSDFMRLLHRNLLGFLLSTENGAKLADELNFKAFQMTSVQIDTLSQIERAMRILRYMVSELNTRIQQFKQLPTTLFANKSMKFVLPAAIDQNYKSKANVREIDKAYIVKPISVLPYKPMEPYLPGFNNASLGITVVIITLALMSLIFGIFGKRTDEKRVYCNKKIGSIFFQITLFAVFIAFAYIGFFAYKSLHRALALQHYECKEKYKTVKIAKPQKLKVVTSPEDSYTWIRRRSSTISSLTANGSICTEIEQRINMPHLQRIYDSLLFYTNLFEYNAKLQKIVFCNLEHFKSSRIDAFPNSAMARRVKGVAKTCKRITQVFQDGIEQYVNYCLNEIKEMENCYQTNFEDYYRTTMTNLDHVGNANLMDTTCAASDNERDYNKCMLEARIFTGYWQAEFEVLLLFILLIPLLMLLSRTYPCPVTKPRVKPVKEEKGESFLKRFFTINFEHADEEYDSETYLPSKESINRRTNNQAGKKRSTVRFDSSADAISKGRPRRTIQERDKTAKKNVEHTEDNKNKTKKQNQDVVSVLRTEVEHNTAWTRTSHAQDIKIPEKEKESEVKLANWYNKLDLGTLFRGNWEVKPKETASGNNNNINTNINIPPDPQKEDTNTGVVGRFLSQMRNSVNYNKLMLGNWDITAKADPANTEPDASIAEAQIAPSTSKHGRSEELDAGLGTSKASKAMLKKRNLKRGVPGNVSKEIDSTPRAPHNSVEELSSVRKKLTSQNEASNTTLKEETINDMKEPLPEQPTSENAEPKMSQAKSLHVLQSNITGPIPTITSAEEQSLYDQVVTKMKASL